MFFSINKSKPGKIGLFILLIVSLCFVAGCYTSAPSRGWSGPVVSEGILYVGTIEDKVIALDVSDGTLTSWEEKDIGETS
ncbi:PQQ-binding-like beta-propeller repeat protein, partial [Chloroflexota bacterium]